MPISSRESRDVRLVLFALATTALWNVTSCGASKRSVPTSAPEQAASENDSDMISAQSDDKSVSVPGLADFVTSTNAFAFDLYRTVRSDNVVIAPHGVVGELQLIHAATEGEAQRQVEETLRVRKPEQNLRDRYRLLLDAVAGRLGPRSSERGFRITSSTGAWYSSKLSASSTFLQTAVEHLATAQTVDFSTPNGLKVVDAHYDDATAGKLTKLLSGKESGPVLLTSATTFDGPWDLPFERALTEDHPFATPTGERMVPTMHGRMRTGFFEGDGFQLLELPYAGRQVSAWFIVAAEGEDAFDATLTSEHFTWMIAQAKQKDVDVRIPRFELEHRGDLSAALSTMGMPGSFAADANLPGFTPSKGAHIGSVVHAARIKIDEDGSDAVATTRSPVNISSKRLPTFEASRPFTVIVRHNGTGAILSLAHVATPNL